MLIIKINSHLTEQKTSYTPKNWRRHMVKLTKKELFDVIQRFTPDQSETSGRGREHFEKAMLNSIHLKCFSKEEKAKNIRIMKAVLDKVFPC